MFAKTFFFFLIRLLEYFYEFRAKEECMCIYLKDYISFSGGILITWYCCLHTSYIYVDISFFVLFFKQTINSDHFCM